MEESSAVIPEKYTTGLPWNLRLGPFTPTILPKLHYSEDQGSLFSQYQA